LRLPKHGDGISHVVTTPTGRAARREPSRMVAVLPAAGAITVAESGGQVRITTVKAIA
jgi:hypothetical protein